MRIRSWLPLFALSAVLARCACSDDEKPTGPKILSTITEGSNLIAGVAATGRVGDFLLNNGEAKFLVQGPDTATGWGIYGGSLVDLAAIRPDRAEDDRLQELFVQCDLRAFQPETAEILNDGTNGEPAVLRFVGKDGGIPFIDAALTRDPLQIELTVDYILPHQGRTMELAIQIKDLRRTTRRDISCGLIMLRGDENDIFLDRIGRDADRAGGAQPYLAAAHHDAPTSWVLHRPEGPVNVLIAQIGIVPIGPSAVPFLANARIEERYFVSLGDGDVETGLAEMRRISPDEVARSSVEIDVRFPGGVETRDDVVLQIAPEEALNRPITAARVGSDNVARFAVPDGRYAIEVQVEGQAVDVFVAEVAGATVLEHIIAGVGAVRVQSREVDVAGTALGERPARIRIATGHNSTWAEPAIVQRYVRSGDILIVPEGEFTLFASMGPAHEVFSENITVSGATEVVVDAQVPRVVDLTGWVSADFHVHSTRSNDSNVRKQARVIGAAAEGVDIVVATDHEGITDYAPVAEELGIDSAQLRTVPGLEMSMFYGHMNGFPMDVAGGEAYWQPSWAVYEDEKYTRQLDPHEVEAAMRGAGAAIVQINHPRGSQSVFRWLDLDPRTGETSKPWPAADTFEILNGKRFDDYQEVFQDIEGLMKSGKRITFTGVSDSHSEYSGVGYARTLIRAPTRDLAALDLDDVWQALKEGRAVATNGPFLFVDAQQGESRGEVGDTLVGMGPVSFSVRVEAPSWVSVNAINLYENSSLLTTLTVTSSDADALNPAIRIQTTLTATPSADSYYLIEVLGARSPPLLKESITLSNPIMVDRAGNGFELGAN